MGSRPAPIPAPSEPPPSPVSQCISINQALACPPSPPNPHPLRRGLGVTCDPWQMVRGLPPLPQELSQPAICQAAQISPLLPRELPRSISTLGPRLLPALPVPGGCRQEGMQGGQVAARSWWPSCPSQTQQGVSRRGGLSMGGLTPVPWGCSQIGLASSGGEGAGRGLPPCMGTSLGASEWSYGGRHPGGPTARGGSGFIPQEHGADKSTWSPEQPQVWVLGWGGGQDSGDPRSPERAQLGEDGGCSYCRPCDGPRGEGGPPSSGTETQWPSGLAGSSVPEWDNSSGQEP